MGLVSVGSCLFDFASVPGAFKLDYDEKGNKVEGTNWESGFKELGKSALRCLGYIAVPAIIGGAAAGAGVIGALVLGTAAFGSTTVLASIFEDIMPTEQKKAEEACKRRGITLKTEEGLIA